MQISAGDEGDAQAAADFQVNKETVRVTKRKVNLTHQPNPNSYPSLSNTDTHSRSGSGNFLTTEFLCFSRALCCGQGTYILDSPVGSLRKFKEILRKILHIFVNDMQYLAQSIFMESLNWPQVLGLMSPSLIDSLQHKFLNCSLSWLDLQMHLFPSQIPY